METTRYQIKNLLTGRIDLLPEDTTSGEADAKVQAEDIRTRQLWIVMVAR